MKPTLKFPPRALAALLLIALLVIVFIWQTNRAGVTPAQSPNEVVSTAPKDIRSQTSSKNASTIEADQLLAIEGARTDVTVSVFPIKEYRYVPPPSGKAHALAEGRAYIHVPSAGLRVSLDANQLGEFPPVDTRTNDTVGVRLALDSVTVDTPVRLVILDGGNFPAAEGLSRLIKAEKGGVVAFEYTTSANTGTHRILVQAAGHPSRILDFTAFATATP